MEDKKIAVKCSTTEQKEEVVKYACKEEKAHYTPPDYSDCINLNKGTHSIETWYKNNGYIIISYEDFKKDYLKKEESPIIGEYYTVIDTAYPEECMVGKVISINEGSTGACIRGMADYIAIFDGQESLDINTSWCYKDGGKRTFRKSTPEEIQWLNACIKEGKFIPQKDVKSELITGEYYVAPSTGNICRWGEGGSDYYFGGDYKGPNTSFEKGNGGFRKSDIRLATPEEKLWLETCIKANKFIPYEEALKQKSMKFNIGDKVKFKTSRIGYIPNYGSDHDGIPRDLIHHGQTTFKENKGEIVNIYEDWYIISFTDTRNNDVHLGFKEDVLKPYIEEKPKPTNLVGRWVKCLKDEAWSSTFKNEFVKKDKFYQLYDIRGDYYGLEGGNCYGFVSWGENQKEWNNIGFELMPEGWTPTSIVSNTEFNIGEEVMFRGAHVTILGFNTSLDECVIDGYKGGHSGNNKLYWFDKSGHNIPYSPGTNRYYVNISSLEKITPGIPKREIIKEGDWVKCIGESATAPGKPTSYGWEKDLVFKVTSITSGDILWAAKNGNGVYNVPGHIRKALPHEISVKTVEISKEPQYVVAVDPYNKVGEIQEKRVLVNLIQPKEGGILDTKVNSTYSVSESLIKPEKVVLF